MYRKLMTAEIITFTIQVQKIILNSAAKGLKDLSLYCYKSDPHSINKINFFKAILKAYLNRIV